MQGNWLFIARVFEGASGTYSEISELPVNEIDWLLKQAVEANDKMADELAKTKRGGRMRGR
jgi:hypothetical protein